SVDGDERDGDLSGGDEPRRRRQLEGLWCELTRKEMEARTRNVFGLY
ncbi:hypothetical protein A2U01_0094058, partial [Trifolium medium]|nr:hypothetical protein [Trifolium medium]